MPKTMLKLRLCALICLLLICPSTEAQIAEAWNVSLDWDSVHIHDQTLIDFDVRISGNMTGPWYYQLHRFDAFGTNQMVLVHSVGNIPSASDGVIHFWNMPYPNGANEYYKVTIGVTSGDLAWDSFRIVSDPPLILP